MVLNLELVMRKPRRNSKITGIKNQQLFMADGLLFLICYLLTQHKVPTLFTYASPLRQAGAHHFVLSNDEAAMKKLDSPDFVTGAPKIV
jgi:hypothetical protein